MDGHRLPSAGAQAIWAQLLLQRSSPGVTRPLSTARVSQSGPAGLTGKASAHCPRPIDLCNVLSALFSLHSVPEDLILFNAFLYFLLLFIM